MADLTDIVGDTPMRKSLVKKRDAEQAKIDKIITGAQAKLFPHEGMRDMYNEMIDAIDKRQVKAVELSLVDEKDADPGTQIDIEDAINTAK